MIVFNAIRVKAGMNFTNISVKTTYVSHGKDLYKLVENYFVIRKKG